jgi:hypothetical protein
MAICSDGTIDTWQDHRRRRYYNKLFTRTAVMIFLSSYPESPPPLAIYIADHFGAKDVAFPVESAS